MKSLTIRIPDVLARELERESRLKNISKSELVRERLEDSLAPHQALDDVRSVIGDLIGSVHGDGLPTDLATNKKKYLPELIRAKKRHRR